MSATTIERARRLRMIDALGIGPAWALRSAPAVLEITDDERRASIASMDLAELAETVTTCRACALCETRTHAVFGDGPRDAHWMVVGVAPSGEDDRAGTPLTGQPGRLLDAMLAAVDGSRQRNVFVTTAVKCCPPGGRDPSPVEVATCRPYLDRQVALLGPRLLLALGDPAARALSDAVAGTRGTVQAVTLGERAVAAVATHGPEALLAEPRLKAEAWADLCVARAA